MLKYILNLEVLGLIIINGIVYGLGAAAYLELLYILMLMFAVTAASGMQALHYHIKMSNIRKSASQQLLNLRKEANKNIQARDDAYWELYNTVKGDLDETK